MYTIKVAQECGCFKRSDLVNNITRNNKDEALSEALAMSNQMNNEFCGKHNFHVIEISNNLIISSRAPEQSSCCGDGCCG